MTINFQWPATRLGDPESSSKPHPTSRSRALCTGVARSNPSVRVLFGIVGPALLAFGCAHSTSVTGASAPVTVVASQPPSQAVLDRRVLSDFWRDIDRYMTLHNKLQRQGTAPKQRG